MNAKLTLSPVEKRMLRSKGIPLSKIAGCSVAQIESALSTSRIRAMEIKALSEFQSVPSIGEKFAHDLISLGYYSLKELKGKNPVKLYNQLEKNIGAWIDPCVEDQFRLVVHYASHRNYNMNWWDFTAERKSYHDKHGYANDRPRRAWHELDEYKKINKVSAKSIEAKNDLVARLRESMSHIKSNYSERLTLSQLSKIALLSPFHFQRSFKSLYEMSPLEFITHLRLKRASRLLKQTKKPITEITVQCGFESTSSFIRLFKKRFSQTPRSYRNRFG